jgi:multiple sugar transport system ATP-binding protein
VEERRPRSCSSTLLERKPKALSGGQRQRVAIGRAIVRDPEGVPVRRAAVQPRRRAARRRCASRSPSCKEAAGSTMIYVTHDQVEAMTLADRIVVLRTAASSRSARRWSSTSGPATCSSPVHRLAEDER